VTTKNLLLAGLAAGIAAVRCDGDEPEYRDSFNTGCPRPGRLRNGCPLGEWLKSIDFLSHP